MRGISILHSSMLISSRFNPAYAGNIDIIKVVPSFIQVQPRVCGEYATDSTIFSTLSGSTPRMRGICISSALEMIKSRFNPAYAGNILKHFVICFWS